MAKTAKEKELEKQMAEAEAKKAGEIAQAQIEVYEGQNYEAKNAYQEAKSKRGTARSKLPEEIPTDPYYKERLLEAQYIKANISSPEHSEEHKHVASYTAEIKKQQKAKETIQVLDKQMPQLYASAVAESKAVEAKAEKAKVAETKKQEELITGFQTAIVTEQKAEAKRVADKKARLDAEAQVREDAYKAYMKGAGSGTNKSVSKQIHYGGLGIPFQKGDIILSAGRGTTGVSFHKSYYERAVESYKARGYNVTVSDLHKVSAAGRRSLSGKVRDSAMRAVLDPSGKSEEAYQQSRAQAKRNVASAYASMSAKEKVHSSAMASTYATNPELKTENQLALVSEMTGGLIGSKKYDVVEGTNTMKVYTKDGIDVTAEVSPIIVKQREIEMANRRQQEYVKELRAGNIGIANALTNPQTTQSYKGTSTVNLGTFLKERGLTAKTAPDSMFKPDYSEKLEKARAQAKVSGDMGDLRTASPMFVGKTNQSYQMKRADSNEINQRKLAQQRVAVFDPKPMDSLVKDSSYVGETGTITIKKNEVLTKKQSDKWGFDPIANQVNKDMQTTWTVTVKQKGAEYTADFKTREEAVAFKKSQEPKVFSGTDNDLWNKFQYASAVDSGELPNPKTTPTLVDDVRYYANVMNRPLINLGASVVNLTQPQDKQVPIYQTGAERLIGGTIDDTLEGQPLRGTGVTGTYNYVKQDPLRAVLELPAEGLMWIAGGKAVSLGTQAVGKVGSKVIQTVVTSSKTPAPVVSGIKTTQRGIEKAQEKMLQYNPFTRWQYKQVEKIGSSVYPDEVPRRIEKIGSTYVITSGTESFPQSVPAVMVKFGKGGKTTYYTDSDLGVAGSKGLVVVGDLPKGIAESTKTGKYLFEVPVKGDRVKLKDYSKTGKEYVTPIESFTKQDVGQQIGFKVSEKTGVARKADEPPFYRGYTKETIIETSTKPQLTKVKYDMDGKVIKDVPVDNKGSTLKDLFGKTSGTGKKETIDLPTGKSGQTLTTPAKQTGKGDKLKSLAKEEAKASVKTSPYSSAIVGTATKASATVSTKALSSTRVDAGVKIQQNIKTGLVQETALKTQQQLKTPQRLKTGMRMETGLKLDTGSKLMTQQKTATMLTIPKITSTRSQTPKAVIFVLPKVEEKVSTRKGKRRKKAGFIGNVRLDNIMGMYKRKEITYGQKKVTKLERQDMRLTAGTKNRIALPSSGLLKTKKKKKSKSETILGRTVTKTKDEFAGFKENKTKKQTKRRKKSKTTKVRLL